MRRMIANIFWLGTKELRAFGRDFVLVALVFWAFSLSIISIARSNLQEIHDASIGIFDEDQSVLSRQISRAFLPPYFKTPRPIARQDIERLMNTGELTFAIDIPPYFQRDLLARREPRIQLYVDATAMMQAGIGAGYAQQIISTEIDNFLYRSEAEPRPPVNLDVRIATVRLAESRYQRGVAAAGKHDARAQCHFGETPGAVGILAQAALDGVLVGAHDQAGSGA